MAKKSIITSFRLNDDDYSRLKALKEKYNISWTKFMAYASILVEKDMKDSEENNNGK